MNRLLMILTLTLGAGALRAESAEAQSPCPGERRDGVPEGSVVIEGDIIVPEDHCQLESVWETNLWPNGEVPYLFSANVTTANQQQMLLAMSYWEDVANVNFRPLSGDINFVLIQNATNNSSWVGMQGGVQIMNITSWSNTYIIAHELGHCLGYYHEQSHPDQINNVQINYQNVCQNCCQDSGGNPISCNFNFNVQSGAGTYGPYDFDSVMHYGQFAWSIQPGVLPTITVLAPNQAWQGLIGQQTHLSVWDKTVMSFLYPESDWVFVDQTAAGSLNFGTFDDPYNAFTLGTFVVPSGGTVWILEPASYADTGVFTKAMTLGAPQGGVVIGS